jgi:membrane protein
MPPLLVLASNVWATSNGTVWRGCPSSRRERGVSSPASPLHPGESSSGATKLVEDQSRLVPTMARRALVATAKNALSRLTRVVSAAGRKYTRDRGSQLAAAISYHVLFSLVPFFIFLASIASLVLQDDELRQDLIDKLLERFPLSEQAGVDLEQLLTDLPTPSSVVAIVSVLGFLWSASGMMAAIRVGLTTAFDDMARPFARSKLVDLLLVLGVGGLFLVAFGLSVVVRAVAQWSETVASALSGAGFGSGGALGIVVPLLISFVAVALLYHLVPPSRPPFREIWVGALVAAIALELVTVGFSYYLATVAGYDALYGSLGSLFAFLFVVYLQASVLLFCAEFAFEWPRRAVAPAERPEHVPLLRRVTGLVRGLFVRG